ncbi:MAG: hypothetical protein U0575_09695 [Phycisphaerales bacterium]
MPARRIRSIVLALAASVALPATSMLLAGCGDMGGRSMPVTNQANKAPSSGSGGHSSSALGKARDSAVRVQDKVDDYNKKIEDAANDVTKN